QLGIGDQEFSTDTLNTEWRVAVGKRVVGEGFYQSEIRVVHLDKATTEIGCVNKRAVGSRGNREPLINCGTVLRVTAGDDRIVHGDECMREIHGRAPAAEGTILSREHK